MYLPQKAEKKYKTWEMRLEGKKKTKQKNYDNKWN